MGIRQRQVSDKPACTKLPCQREGALSYSGAHASGNGDLHEAGSSGDHDVLHIWQRLEFGCASQYWGLLPDAKVLKEVLAGAIDACTTRVRSRTSQGCVTIHVPFEIPLVPLM